MHEEDYEAMAGTNRGKIYFLGMVVAVAGAAAAWQYLVPRGIGQPEEGDAVVIVQEGQRGMAAYLGDYGFGAVTGSRKSWEKSIPKEIPELAGKEIGVAEILHWADTYGFAYVAIENPQEYDLSGIDMEPAPQIDEHTKFLVLSAGDYAHPHYATTNPAPSEVMDGRGLNLLRALFLQPQLAETLDTATAGMEAIRLRTKLGPAVDKLEQLATLEADVEKIMLETTELLEPTSATKGAQIHLADKVSEGSNIIPIADGRMMTLSRGASLESPNGIRLDMTLSREWEIRALAPGAKLTAESRESCTELLGGTVDRAERLASHGSRQGDTVLLQSVAEGSTLYRFKPDAGPCGLEKIGAVEMPEDFRGYLAVGHEQVAAKSRANGRAYIHVRDAKGGATELAGMESRGTKSLTWLDDTHLAMVSYGDEHPSIAFFSMERPDIVLDMPVPDRGDFFEIHILPGLDHAAFLVRTRTYGVNRIERVDFNQTWAQLFESAEERPERTRELEEGEEPPPEGEGGPSVRLIDPATDLTVTPVVEIDAGMKPYDLSPDGKWVAYSSFFEDGKKEIHLVAVPDKGGSVATPITVTSDDLYDRDPVFSRDGKRLYWRTEHPLGKTEGKLFSARAIELSDVLGK